MADCRSLEEFLMGPEGQEARGLRPKLEEIVAEAKSQGIDRIAVEIRSTPAGTTQSRTDGNTSFKISDPTDPVLDALRRELESAPGESFAGELRLNFRAYAGKREYLGSFTRNMRPQLASSLPISAGGKDLELANLIVATLLKPVFELQIRHLDASARLLEQSAAVVAASKGPGLDPKAGILNNALTQLGGLVRGDQMQNQSAPIAPVPVQGSPPPPPVGSDSPSTPAPAKLEAREPTEAEVREWLAKHNGRAVAIGMELAEKNGFQVVPA